MNTSAETKAVAETLADQAASLAAGGIPDAVRTRTEELLIDVVGLCVAARNMDYMKALLAGVDSGGPCTAIGHAATFAPETAAMINGTAAHGEDFGDTFEGGPVH
ncbi:MAG: MmgE/PrpD family protein, partial [Pseudomonadota bacterium]